MAEQKFSLKLLKLTENRRNLLKKYFDEEVESNVIPILLHDHVQLPYLRKKPLSRHCNAQKRLEIRN